MRLIVLIGNKRLLLLRSRNDLIRSTRESNTPEYRVAKRRSEMSWFQVIVSACNTTLLRTILRYRNLLMFAQICAHPSVCSSFRAYCFTLDTIIVCFIGIAVGLTDPQVKAYKNYMTENDWPLKSETHTASIAV